MLKFSVLEYVEACEKFNISEFAGPIYQFTGFLIFSGGIERDQWHEMD